MLGDHRDSVRFILDVYSLPDNGLFRPVAAWLRLIVGGAIVQSIVSGHSVRPSFQTLVVVEEGNRVARSERFQLSAESHIFFTKKGSHQQ